MESGLAAYSSLKKPESAVRISSPVKFTMEMYGMEMCIRDSFFDPEEYDLFIKRYGSMAHLQTMGNLPAENPMA